MNSRPPSLDLCGSALTYTLFDPTPCGFPPPRVPLLPMLTARALGRSQGARFALVGAGRSRRVYKRGRYALFDAYRLSGVGAEGALLAPAYHCRTMLDPAISLGGELLLYELNPDLSPRLDSLERLIGQARRPVRAMLLTHYFGFPQDAGPLQAFCESHGIALIEDCSHALFNLRGRERLGMHGRYTIASPYKLLPCEEGGLLIPSAGAAMPATPPRSAPLRAELSVLATTVQRKLANRPPRGLEQEMAAMDAVLADLGRSPRRPESDSATVSAGTSSMYLAHEEGLAGTRAARWLMALCDIDHAAQRRRSHYQRWAATVAALPHCRPLFEQLPEDCAPYMFPLLIEQPQQHFFALKKLGMPIWRWDEMALSGCAVAAHYRQRLLHLPCHQALSTSELDWMLAAVSKVLGQPPFKT
jgi:dTDP-4-amino-4,6-dideoxygalactose transaminase